MAELVGILRQAGRGGTVFPEGKTDYGEIYVPPDKLNGAPYGMKVVVTVDVPPETPDPNGTVTEVLGDPERPDVAIQGIIKMHGLRQTFPGVVSEEALRTPTELSELDIERSLSRGRRDLRDLPTMTIDGKDAKDLDDAISIKRLADGNYRLWVHIADVAEYVRPNSEIDQEALKRGNSVYLVDRVLPMLPPQLSNAICSLNPNQDRFALTCMMDYSEEGDFLRGEVYESLIRSDLRGNYDDVFASLEEGAPVEGYEDMWIEIQVMRELSLKLHDKRVAQGSLEFEFPETKVVLDSEGTPTDIHAYPSTYANNIIEEFMIASNIFVAKHFGEKELPLIYRVHELPDPEKLKHFMTLANIQGEDIRLAPEPSQQDLADALLQVQKLPAGQTLASLLLRALAKAVYSQEPKGHFGLALDDYAHFTSPIRRYPDLFVHRVIKGYLRKDLPLDRMRRDAPDVALHCSETERAAMYAEYDTIDLKAAEYMKQYLGEVFSGRISGFNNAGIYVQLENTVEGMVPFRTMNEYYFYDERTLTAQSETSGRLLKIGDEVDVIVARADTVRRQVDFHLANEKEVGLVMAQLRETYAEELGQIPTKPPRERKKLHSKRVDDRPSYKGKRGAKNTRRTKKSDSSNRPSDKPGKRKRKGKRRKKKG